MKTHFDLYCCGFNYKIAINYKEITEFWCGTCKRKYQYFKSTDTVKIMWLHNGKVWNSMRNEWQHYKFLCQFKTAKINSQNYKDIYFLWQCENNKIFPLSQIEFDEIFFDCEDYAAHLAVLIDCHELITRLSFMKDKNTNDALAARLHIRIELFKRVPSATNMLLAYNLIEELILKYFAQGADISDEVNKNIERFDKCKALALNTKFIAERQNAFNRTLRIFQKLTQIEI